MRATIKTTRLLALGGASTVWAVLTACNHNGDFFFPEVDVPDVYILTAKDGGDIVPVDIESLDDIRESTIYAELGPPRTTGYGGVTFDITGNGGDICVWVDPEIAFWNEAIAARPGDLERKYAYPDNVFDDGDIDLLAGLSVYYTGSPGEVIGDFVVQYEDSLGNIVPVSLAACPNRFGAVGDPAVGGRGSPDYCTLPATESGVSYTILLRTWSTPLDDDRLGFGLLVANGDCEDIKDIASDPEPNSVERDECLIEGEAIRPEGKAYGPYYGFDAVRPHVWDHSLDFEETFCIPPDPENRDSRMLAFCEKEVERMDDEGRTCEREVIDDPKNRCFCGDPTKSPTPGGAP